MRSKAGLHVQSALYGLMLLFSIIIMSLSAYSISWYAKRMATANTDYGGVTGGVASYVTSMYTYTTSRFTYSYRTFTTMVETYSRTWSTYTTTSTGRFDGQLTTRTGESLIYTTFTIPMTTSTMTNYYTSYVTSSTTYSLTYITYTKRDQTTLALPAQTTVPTLPVTSERQSRAGSMATPAPTPTAASEAPFATITAAPKVHAVKVEVPVSEGEESAPVHQLEKRRRGSGGGSGGSKISWSESWRPLRIVELVWSLMALLYIVIFFIVRQAKPANSFVGVGSDKGWLGFLLLFGIIVAIVSAAWYGTYSEYSAALFKVFPAAAALLAFTWLLIVVLLATLIFEYVYAAKTMGVHKHMSIQEFVNSQPDDTLTPPEFAGKPGDSTVFGSPAAGTPVMMPQHGQPIQLYQPYAPQGQAMYGSPGSPAMGQPGMVPMGSPGMVPMGSPGTMSPNMHMAPGASAQTMGDAQQQYMYQPTTQGPPPCLCNAYAYPHPPHPMTGSPGANPVSPAITPLQV